MNQEQNFSKLNEEKRRTDDDAKARLETSLVFIATLRNEIDERKNALAERRRANADLQ